MTSTDTRTRTGLPQTEGYRPDIEGLRAVAIGLVLIYHAGVRHLPGGFVGVDVFFVISGFLITGLLIKEMERHGRISLSRFYARRAKRLLPATGLVLITTTALTWWTTTVVEWRTFGLDIVGAATYVINWRLASRSVDYLAEDVGPSPVQHFWSLAVEEQFYVVWPLLLLVVGWWVRRRSASRLRAVMSVGIAAVIVPSFIWSVHLTNTNAPVAFFVTTTRLWELGIGAFVAIGAVLWHRVPRGVAIVLGWSGAIAVALSGFVVTEQTPWPGYWALLPTLGTAAVIVAGYTSGRAGPAGILAWKPAVWIGGLSYSLYLWHWPLIVAATAYWGGLSAERGLLVAAFAFVPAYLSYRFVENPIRFAQPLARSNRLTLSLGANFSLVGVVAGLALVLLVPVSGVSPERSEEALGAASIGKEEALADSDTTGEASGVGGNGTVASLAQVDWFTPAATEATSDIPQASQDGCQVNQTDPEPIVCEYGDPGGDVSVVVVGDSKILQWQTAFDTIAREEGWHVYSFTKSACAFSAGMQMRQGELYPSCLEWTERVLDRILELDPDVVITGNRVKTLLEDPNDLESRTAQAMEDALTERWSQVTSAGIPMVVMIDNPSPGISVYECMAENETTPENCTFDRATGVENSGALPQKGAAKRVEGVSTVEMADVICPDTACVPVIGNVLVYRQTSHLTDTFVRTLMPVLRDRLVPTMDKAITSRLTG